MAHLHFRRTVYKRGGGKASQRLEYITRQPERELTAAERQLRYTQGEREDLVFAQSRNLPAFANGNPHVFFRAAEAHERYKGVAFEEWKITLPQELSHRQNMDLTRDLVDAIACDKLPCTYAFHDPRTLDEQQQQPHLHVLISSRQNDGYERTAEQHFRRWNAQHPERGGAQKDEAFRHMGSVMAHRMLIADVLNIHLERAGLAVRVHPDSLHDRGIDRKPEPKLLPSESRAYRERGEISTTMQQVLAIRAERAQQMAREQNNARHYWEGRKAELGITRDQPMTHKLERITQARTHTMTHAPARQRQGPAPEQAIHVRVPAKPTRRQELAQRQQQDERTRGLQSARQRLRELTRSLGREEESAPGGLRVRLDREEERQGYDRGMGS